MLVESARYRDPSDIEGVRLAVRFVGWRSIKAVVDDEIKLPPQQSDIIRVKFGPIESYYYKKLQDKLGDLISSS